jgi:hypothetical protein
MEINIILLRSGQMIFPVNVLWNEWDGLFGVVGVPVTQ